MDHDKRYRTRLKQELRDECADVVRARREVLGIEVPLTEDELAKSIGIQHLLTPKKAAREQHIHNIISRQDNWDPEALGIIAMYSSKQDGIRAHELAVHNEDKFQQGLHLGFQMKLIEALTCLQKQKEEGRRRKRKEQVVCV